MDITKSTKTKSENRKVLRDRSISESKDGNCVLCCEKAQYFAVGPCDHPICFKCSSRMRVLSKQHYCAACRAEMDQVAFCHTPKKFSEFNLKHFTGRCKHGIRFEDKIIEEAYEFLLGYGCNECGKEKSDFFSFQELKAHARKVHEKQLCQICIDNLSIFPREFKFYTKKELVSHRREGDKDELSHRGHPECRFCNDRFFDNDALLLHLRKNHFWCHFCEHDGKQDYYNVYNDLRRHFATDHYLCDEGNCINEKFTSAFRNKIDYQAHKLAAHGKKLNKIQAREARKVDINYSFSRRPQHGSVINGSDYEEVNREDRKRGNQRNRGEASSNNNRRGQHNNRINFYDYEDVEKDRKEFLGKARRHEAEEVDDRHANRLGIVAASSLSSSEPDIHNRVRRNLDVGDSDDDVIGLPEHMNTHEERRAKKEVKKKVKKDEEVKTAQPADLQQQPNVNQNYDATDAGARAMPSEEDFPALSGVPSLPIQNKSKQVVERVEDFPVLGKPKQTKEQKLQNGKTVADATKLSVNTPKTNLVNGIPIVKSKRKNKGKPKPQQSMVSVQKEARDDFPALGNAVQTHKNVKTSKQTITSGQKKTSAIKKTPPGFSNAGKSTPSAPPPPGLSKAKTTKEGSKGHPPGLSKGPDVTLNKNIQERNFRLLSMLQTYLDDFNLQIFKNLSGDFRRGFINGERYYKDICELLGENMKYVFSELVALLPDESKQQELLFAHNNAKIAMTQMKELQESADYAPKSTWGATPKPLKEKVELSRCEQCGQTFPKEESMKHMESHGDSFPSLPTTVRKKKNYTFAPAYQNRSFPIRNAWGK